MEGQRHVPAFSCLQGMQMRVCDSLRVFFGGTAKDGLTGVATSFLAAEVADAEGPGAALRKASRSWARHVTSSAILSLFLPDVFKARAPSLASISQTLWHFLPSHWTALVSSALNMARAGTLLKRFSVSSKSSCSIV